MYSRSYISLVGRRTLLIASILLVSVHILRHCVVPVRVLNEIYKFCWDFQWVIGILNGPISGSCGISVAGVQ